MKLNEIFTSWSYLKDHTIFSKWLDLNDWSNFKNSSRHLHQLFTTEKTARLQAYAFSVFQVPSKDFCHFGHFMAHPNEGKRTDPFHFPELFLQPVHRVDYYRYHLGRGEYQVYCDIAATASPQIAQETLCDYLLSESAWVAALGNKQHLALALPSAIKNTWKKEECLLSVERQLKDNAHEKYYKTVIKGIILAITILHAIILAPKECTERDSNP